ncbi:MAG: hypothetical protein AVDCRST_MAG34-3054 [uncultured Nocardioidaceae bacterium]|uniref:Uncharacterized protein n=1 Tax=uncultured Nocardioidaceae bacterium TaxID=253824 RepID=A0A6J4MUC0_9ACTN|nr:MAG: hypothetical protein AVDCRST_MAG34-3054 [uncultured Nocardioidaceae bacterium]
MTVPLPDADGLVPGPAHRVLQRTVATPRTD